LTWSVSDALSSAAAASTVTVHTPPSLGGGGATATFIGGGPAVTLDAGLTVSDVDSTTLTTATVTIGSGFLPGDTLAANTSGTNITASYDSTTHTLTLSGTASVQDYQKVLESVTYSFPGTGDPTQGGNTTRTISWAVNDGVAWSNSATTTLSTVNAVHAPPSVAGAGNITPYSKQGPAAVVDGALTLSDPDSGGMLTGATVTISSGFLSGDTLAAVTTGTGITASYNANTGVLTLTGQDTIAHYQSVLDSVTYSSTNNNPSQGNKDTTRTITWVVNDGATSNNLSAPVTSMIDLTPGQSVVHAPHGKNAAPVLASSAVAPTPGGSAPLVTYVDTLQSADGDEHDAVPAWTAAHSRSERDDHAALDLRHAVVATDAELLAARRGQAGDEGRHLGDGDKRAHGKPSLLAQLKAAGRHGFAHERQALIKDLPKRSAVR
jgi:lipopolysaccharide export system protein LptA